MLLRAPEAHSRSIVKAISWRILGSIDTFVISYFVTGKLVFAASIAGVETFTKICLFYFHEQAWARVPWGRADRAKAAKAAKLAAEQAKPASEAGAAAQPGGFSKPDPALIG
jgi:uncharacterized membrane protein